LRLLQLGNQLHLNTLELLDIGLHGASLSVLIVNAAHVRLSAIVLALSLIVIESRSGLHGCGFDSLLLVAIFIDNGLLEVRLLVLASHSISLRVIGIVGSLFVEVSLDLVAVVGLLVGCIVVLLGHETFVCVLELVCSFFISVAVVIALLEALNIRSALLCVCDLPLGAGFLLS